MRFDLADRLYLINEAILNLLEAPTAGGNSVPPSLPPGQPRTPEQEEERNQRLADTRTRLDAEQQAKFKKQRSDVEEAKKFNPDATRFYPRWSDKGEDRVNKLRGYMDYLRMDPDRLRLFKQQSAYASANMVGQAQRARTAYDRSAASTAQRIADYQAGDRDRRLDRIRSFDPQAANSLERGYAADDRAKSAAQQWGQIGSDINKSSDQIEKDMMQRRIDRFRRDMPSLETPNEQRRKLEDEIRGENLQGYG
jgi:hypothetical protein